MAIARSASIGQLSITRSGPKPAYLDEELFMPNESGSQVLRSVIDSPENSPMVALTNISATSNQTLHVSCIPSIGVPFHSVFTLQPKQTVLARACTASAPTIGSVANIDIGFDLSPESATGMAGQGVAGISITSDGPAAEIAAFGFVEHNDSFGDYFSDMNFYDPRLLHASGLVFAGVPVGSSRLLPSATYTPQLAVTNFSASPQTVTASFATTSAGFNSLKQIASLSVPANSSRMVALPGLSGDPDWQNSFIIHASGTPGDVVSKMMFKSASALPNIELIGKDEDHITNAGDHPWSVENGMRSTLVLFNYGPSPRETTVRIASGNDVWMKIYTLLPKETRAISINAVLQARVPDDDKHVLSPALLNGDVGWWAPSSGAPQVTGRVVQVDAGGAMARNFSCPTVLGLCDVTMSLNALFLQTNDPEGIGGSPDFCEYESAPTGCPNDNLPAAAKATLNWNWNSANTSIAHITNGATLPTSTWAGVAPGNTSSSVMVVVQNNSRNYCQVNTPVTVSNCQSVPEVTGETTTYAGSNTGNLQTISNFNMVLQGTGNYTGWTITEQEGASGVNGCWAPNTDPVLDPQSVSVKGSQWTVASGNSWGPDQVGWFANSVNYIPANSPYSGHTLIPNFPCGFQLSQTQHITCPGGSGYGYDYEANNRLTGTIYGSSVQNCRLGVCANENH